MESIEIKLHPKIEEYAISAFNSLPENLRLRFALEQSVSGARIAKCIIGLIYLMDGQDIVKAVSRYAKTSAEIIDLVYNPLCVSRYKGATDLDKSIIKLAFANAWRFISYRGKPPKFEIDKQKLRNITLSPYLRSLLAIDWGLNIEVVPEVDTGCVVVRIYKTNSSRRRLIGHILVPSNEVAPMPIPTALSLVAEIQDLPFKLLYCTLYNLTKLLYADQAYSAHGEYPVMDKNVIRLPVETLLDICDFSTIVSCGANSGMIKCIECLTLANRLTLLPIKQGPGKSTLETININDLLLRWKSGNKSFRSNMSLYFVFDDEAMKQQRRKPSKGRFMPLPMAKGMPKHIFWPRIPKELRCEYASILRKIILYLYAKAIAPDNVTYKRAVELEVRVPKLVQSISSDLSAPTIRKVLPHILAEIRSATFGVIELTSEFKEGDVFLRAIVRKSNSNKSAWNDEDAREE